jgi:hypothetical protein
LPPIKFFNISQPYKQSFSMVDIADYTKKMAQIGINYAFPRTGTIAAISAGVGWYTYQWGLTFGPQLAANAVIRQWEEWVPFAGWYIGKGLSPFIIPQATPYIASQISLGCSLATTLTLNVIAQVFFKIKEQPDHKH